MSIDMFTGMLGGFGSHFETAANTVALVFMLSPAVQIFEVYRSKGNALTSTSPFNLISMYANCAMWLIYGLLYPVPPAVPCNAIGLVACCAYLSICWFYAVRKHEVHGWHLWCADGSWSISAATGTTAALIFSGACYVYAAGSPAQAEHVGYLAMVVNVVMYGAPLSGVGRVIADKSSATLPPVQCALGFLCSSLWLCVGLNNRNVPTVIPNALGVPLAALQLLLIAWFPRTATKLPEVAQPLTEKLASASADPTSTAKDKDSNAGTELKQRRGRASSPAARDGSKTQEKS